MLLNRHSLDIPARFAGGEDGRYALRLAEIDGTQIVTTDGHRLCVITHPDGKPEEFPAAGQSSKLKPLRNQTVRVNAEALQNVAKALPKGRKIKSLPVLMNALLDTTKALGNGTVPFHVTDLETSRTIEIKKEDARFPNWRHLLPTQEPEYRLVVDADYLQDIGKAFADFRGDARHPAVTIEFHGGKAPIVFTSRNPDTGQDMTILLMPMNDKLSEPGLNRAKVLRDWASGVTAHMDYDLDEEGNEV